MSVPVDDSIKALAKKRSSIKARLTNFKTYLTVLQQTEGTKITYLQIKELSMRTSRLEDLFTTFDGLQTELEALCDDTEAQVSERDYIENNFITLLCAAQSIIDASSVPDKKQGVSDQDQANNYGTTGSGTFNAVKLPTIHLPTFDGNYLKWLEFRDTFESLIHSNESIPAINKFHYLRSALEGSASVVIKSIEFASKNYEVAWDLLCDRYNNKNILINNHLKALFNMDTISKESFKALRFLIDHVSKNLRALDTLGQSTDQWDVLIIFMVSAKLDSITSRKWEEHKITLSEVPTLINFYDFLRNRADILETAYCNRSDRCDYKPIQRPTKSFVASVDEQTNERLCVFCNQRHLLYQCQKFQQMAPENRISEVARLKLCTNCLRGGHNSFQCRLKGCCRLCRRKHNTLVHKDKETGNNTETVLCSAGPSVPVSLSAVLVGQVLLCTALVDIVNPQNKETYTARALLDPGSQSSFLTENFKTRMGLVIHTTAPMSVTGIGNVTCDITKRCQIKLKSRINKFDLDVTCLIVPTITGTLPNAEVNVHSLNLPNNIDLADPNFFCPSEIDILLGADVFWDIVGSRQIKLGTNKPTLQESQFGWLVAGPTGGKDHSKRKVYCNFVQEIHDSLKRFWEIDELKYENKLPLTIEEQSCERHFLDTTQKLPSGRFSVKLPLKESPDKALGESFFLAKRRFLNLEKRLNKDANLKQAYCNFISEYKSLGHLSEVERPRFGYYLPHHCVIRDKSETTKLRVVFDASAKTSSGKSLNDIQYVGPVIQSDLLSILLRFRVHKFVLTADIQKMYRQIELDESQRHLQLILWRDDERQLLKICQLNTVTYGTASAPFLSTRCLVQLAHECKDKTIANVIQNDFYVDDLNTGSTSEEELRRIYENVNKILLSACFPLMKVRTNCPQIFEGETTLSESLDLSKESTVLGLSWSPKLDTINFSTAIETAPQITKRTIISMTCRVFDPLGLLCAYIIKAKIILQQLWCAKLGWDDPVPEQIVKKWVKFIDNLPQLSTMHLSRYVLCNNPQVIELHCFVDASKDAYGACVYLRSTDNQNDVTVKLLCAKARVAPLKPLTIPRLELCGAYVGAHLCTKVIQSLRCDIAQTTIWTDSTVVLGWLKTQSKNLKAFVFNRVSEINELTRDFQWRHVPTESNPADLASRGIEAQQLIKSDLWWEGPSFLKKDPSEWPQYSPIQVEKLPELKIQSLFTSVDVETNQTCIIQFENYSNYLKLKRIMAYVLRFINNCKKNKTKLTGSLNTTELEQSLVVLVKLSQSKSFSREIKQLQANEQLHYKSKLLSLSPFIDSNGIIRVGGRLNNSSFQYDKKHPILLDAKHYFAKLIMKGEHLRLYHAGPQLLLASVREQFWPIGGRHLARSTTKRCVTCTRLRGKTMQPIMGDLPAVRTNSSFTFYTCGVDFAGPFSISSRKGRGNRITKCYLSLFVCLVTKAIHLEVVSDLSTEAFILSLRRFVSRRGKPSEIYCDNGTNFVGASNELGRVLRASRQSVSDYATNEGIKFMFIPAYSPHFGGIWEAGVKSAKNHLKRVAGNASLTFEELTTLFTQIEAILNSRPLSPLSSDPTDISPLTPGHFLIGRPLMSVPSLPVNCVRPNRYQRIEQIRQQFWDRWRKEFVAELQQRTKWKTRQLELAVNDLVILKEDNLPPLRWRLGRISKLYPGPDGVNRVADVTTARGTIKRAVNKMCILPIEN